MQFKVDSSGAWLNNSTFVLQKDYGGKIIIDPEYGIVAGTGNLYSTSGTTVYPSFIGNNGRLSFYITRNMIHATEAISIGSDCRIKKDIDYDLSKFKDFFYHLKPSSYQYKQGTSGRVHTGFIAQDVENALENAGLSTQDFAGLTIEPVEEIMEDGISDYRYSLRYEEFISLNTYMIQELNRKIQEVELKIKKLSRGV